MNLFSRLRPLVWIVVLLGACAWVCRIAAVNLGRAETLSNLGGGDTIATAAASPTGYAGGVRKLVLPEPNYESLQWIAQTQEMLARGEWRLRHIGSDNAPVGRPTFAPSPYRWWLGAVAWADSRLSGRPLGQSVERAAVLAGPLLHLLLLASTTVYAARYLGPLSAGLLAAALAFGFPFAGNFLSPLPGDRALAQALAVWMVLPLVVTVGTRQRGRGHFVFAGLAGGAALWIDVGPAALLIFGCTLGGLLAAGLQRGIARDTSVESGAALPWRGWAWAGAGTSLLAYVVEYAPNHLAGWRLEWNHPLYALAWLGAGEVLYWGSPWLAEGRRPGWLRMGLALGALGPLFLGLLLADSPGMFGPAAHTARLSLLPGTNNAGNLLEWMFHAPNTQLAALFLPFALLVPAGWCLWARPASPASCAAVAVGLGPVLVLLVFTGWHLAFGAALGGVWAALLVALTAAISNRSRAARWSLSVAVALAAIPGAVAVWPITANGAGDAVTSVELEALLQRDLAHWLAARAPEEGAVVLAPPAMTSALHFYGGIRGIGTPDPGNREGFAAAVRLCAATSADEAELLARKREITHVVRPSWDPFLDEYARLGTSQPEKTLMAWLHRWLPPRWLRPVPYLLPQADGIGNRTVVVFEVTEMQDQAGALARLGEYFVEMGRLDDAGQVALVLSREFPDDINGYIARAAVALARGDGAEVGRVLLTLRPVLDRGGDEDLPWDRRVALALVLAQGRQPELAKKQVRGCLTAADQMRLRQLSTVGLFRLLVLGKAFGMQIEDPALQAYAYGLLPPDMRARF
ncbi:MAG: hypothetical protein IPL39_23385 [Opitutaceae bacterium]|nr:hypothetical protein [Opitutaceae bacterium]